MVQMKKVLVKRKKKMKMMMRRNTNRKRELNKSAILIKWLKNSEIRMLIDKKL